MWFRNVYEKNKSQFKEDFITKTIQEFDRKFDKEGAAGKVKDSRTISDRCI